MDLIDRVDEINTHLETWVGVDFLESLCSGLDGRLVAAMIFDAASQPLFSTRLGALLTFAVLVNANRVLAERTN